MTLTDRRTISETVAACASQGGGRVVVPAGKWMTGAIHLKSNVELHLEDGAEVVFSQNVEDYLPAVQTSYEGTECWNYSPLIYAFGCTNVAITGSGTAVLRAFEGEHADSIWGRWTRESAFRRESARKIQEWAAKDVPVERRRISDEKNSCTRPHFIQFNRCRNVRLENVRIRNSPFWTIHLFLCDGAVVRDVDVVARHSNNDGIDIEMTRNVLVERCSFDQGDDTFVIKSGRNRDGWRLGVPTENIEIRDCHMKRAKSFFAVGSEISGGVRNVRMHDCSVGEAVMLAYVKTNRRRGGFVENIRMSNVKCGKVRTLLGVETEVFYGMAGFPDYELRRTRIGDIALRDVFCDEVDTRVDIQGDAELPVAGVCLENVRVGSARIPDRLVNVTDVVEDGHPVAVMKDFPITDFGAKPDGPADASAAMVRAVETAELQGRGRVVVPPGTWKTGPIELKKGVGLHLSASSRLLFSDNPADYVRADGSHRPLLSAEGLENVRISGGFGSFEALVNGWRSLPAKDRPPLVRFARCKGVFVESVALHNAPGKVVELADCENVRVTSVELTANVPEEDFISVVSGTHPTVRSCSFRIGDGTWDVLDPRHRIVHPFCRMRWLYPQMDMGLYRVHEMRDTVRRMGLRAMHPGKLPPLRDCAEFRRRCAESDPLPEAAGRLSARYDAKDGMRYVTVNGGFLGGGAIRSDETGWEAKVFDGSWHPVADYPDSEVPPHRERLPEDRRFAGLVATNGFFDAGEEVLAFVECEAECEPKLFVGESVPEMMCSDRSQMEYDPTMTGVADGRWRTRFPLAFRYLRFADPVRNVKVVPVGRNRPVAGALETSNARWARMFDAGVRTLKLCSDDFLIDGIKRDRLPWGGDLTVSLLADAYVYGDAEVARRSLSVLDAYEGDVNGIVTYSMWTIVSHDLYQLYFGDGRFLWGRWWRIRERVEDLLARTDETGFVVKGLDWVFVDWAKPESTTALQVIWYGALQAAARLASRVGDARADAYRAAAEKVKDSLDRLAWDETRGLYRANPDDANTFGRQANVYAVVFGLAEGERAARMGAELAADRLPPVGTPYVYGWELVALARTGQHQAFFAGLEKVFGAMLDAGATTFWEGFDASEKGDARYAFYGRPWGKSLCHVWSAWPAFIFASEALGVRPTSDGWKTWERKPMPGAEGLRVTVPTPGGILCSESL